MSDDNNGWSEYSRLVLKELETLATSIQSLNSEIQELNDNHYNLKNEIETNQKYYEKLIEEATDEISSFVEKANLENLS